jgi:hypothetical protein
MLRPACFTLRLVLSWSLHFDNQPLLQKQAVPPTPTRKAPPTTLLIAAPVRPTAPPEALPPHRIETATKVVTAASDAQCMSQGRLPAAANPNTTTTSMHSIATVARAIVGPRAAVNLAADTGEGLTTAVAAAAVAVRAAAARIRKIARALAATEGKSRLLSCWSARESEFCCPVHTVHKLVRCATSC